MKIKIRSFNKILNIEDKNLKTQKKGKKKPDNKKKLYIFFKVITLKINKLKDNTQHTHTHTKHKKNIKKMKKNFVKRRNFG